MPRFTNPKDLERHMRRAMDALAAQVIITTQAELGSAAVSPISTGRLRSSWFAAESSPSSEVPPEGANSPNTDANSLRVDSSKEYHLTSSLPYSQYICLEGKAVNKPANWFFDFQNTRIPKIQEAAARVVGKRFDLL
jgi:hypothetical protein